jgi:predicted cupin superfamily sugar epimerase
MSFNSYLPDTVQELVEQLGLIPHPEGGFFMETHRSGSQPMISRGQSDLDVPEHCLVTTTGRTDRRPDKSNQRNCITSIFWVPTAKSPVLPLTVNLSDHVHYYQGGLPFQYHIYDAPSNSLQTVVLGPNLAAGQKLQVTVTSEQWKCGKLLVTDNDIAKDSIKADYCIVAEAVAPGFDFHDFNWVDKADMDKLNDTHILGTLTPFLYKPPKAKEEQFDGHYNDDDATKQLTEERM